MARIILAKLQNLVFLDDVPKVIDLSELPENLETVRYDDRLGFGVAEYCDPTENLAVNSTEFAEKYKRYVDIWKNV